MVLTEENERRKMEEETLTNTVATVENNMISIAVNNNSAVVADAAPIPTINSDHEIEKNLDTPLDKNYYKSKDLPNQEPFESLEQSYEEDKPFVETNIQQPTLNDSFNDSILVDQRIQQYQQNPYQNHNHLNHYHQHQQQQFQLQQQPILPPLAPEYPLKHPLQNTWTLWYLESDRTKSWEELQNEITSFNTVEDFWCLYNHIKLASEIKIGSDYSLFKKGIRPMWEDEANIKGGRWVLTLSRQYRRTYLDNLWLDVLLCLIGEVFDFSGQICGAVVNIRTKADKISIWTADGNDRDAVLEIGNKLKEYLNYDPERLTLVYQMHKDTMVKQGSSVRNTYTL